MNTAEKQQIEIMLAKARIAISQMQQWLGDPEFIPGAFLCNTSEVTTTMQRINVVLATKILHEQKGNI